MRRLIVNADDFGRCEHANAGIARAFDEGIVTSASLMVRPESAGPAARLAAERPELSVGLHLDLGEWRPLGDGEWEAVYEVAALDDPAAVEREARAQLDRFRALLGRDPTHLDSHQHVHHDEAAPVARALAAELGVTLRGADPAVAYCGAFYGRAFDGSDAHEFITVDNLVAVVRELPDGTTELACHPGTPGCRDPAYGPERALELETLCDPRVREAVTAAGVQLVSRRAVE